MLRLPLRDELIAGTGLTILPATTDVALDRAFAAVQDDPARSAVKILKDCGSDRLRVRLTGQEDGSDDAESQNQIGGGKDLHELFLPEPCLLPV